MNQLGMGARKEQSSDVKQGWEMQYGVTRQCLGALTEGWSELWAAVIEVKQAGTCRSWPQ